MYEPSKTEFVHYTIHNAVIAERDELKAANAELVNLAKELLHEYYEDNHAYKDVKNDATYMEWNATLKQHEVKQ
jgi:hypothetical protein